MGFFFRSKSKNVVSPTTVNKQTNNANDAIDKIRLSIENAEKREKFLQNKIERSILPEAKQKMAQGDKRGALNLMKRKKMYQSEIEKLENVRMTLETQCIQLESATHNQNTIQAMQSGTSAMKGIRTMFGIDKVDELVEDIREEADMAEDISNAIATPLDPYMMDDDELMKELNTLEEEQRQDPAAVSNNNNNSSFWSIPTGIPSRKTQAEKDREDLANLEAEMMLA